MADIFDLPIPKDPAIAEAFYKFAQYIQAQEAQNSATIKSLQGFQECIDILSAKVYQLENLVLPVK